MNDSTAIEQQAYFLPYQLDWINDDSPYKVAEKSRRVGFTYASSYRMWRKCMNRGKGFIQWVSSRDEMTAQELIRDYVRKWCELGNVVAKGMYGENVEMIDPEKNIRAFVVEFPNGARLISLSSKPEAFAGKGGDVFLDEVDLHDDSGRLIDMAYPCILWGGQLEIVSAYRVNGTSSSPFAQLVKSAKGENPMEIRLHRVTLPDAVEQGLVEKINVASGRSQTRDEFTRKVRASCRTQSAYNTQFLCITDDAAGKLITLQMITPCELEPVELAALIARNPTAPRFGGYDVARKLHASSWHEYIQLGVSLYLARREIWRDVEFEVQEKWLRSRLTDKGQPRIARMAIDATGLGMNMAENLTKAFPGRVDAVNLESSRRTELCVSLRDRYASTRIYIPADDQLRADINGPEKQLAKNGGLRIYIPAFDNDAGETSHCDEFVASMLACSAAEEGIACNFVPRAGRGRRAVARRERLTAIRNRRAL
jgi:phage FluMu gp28-like protein